MKHFYLFCVMSFFFSLLTTSCDEKFFDELIDAITNDDDSGSSSGSGTSSSITNGLMAYYTFDDGTAKNTKGSNYTGTLAGEGGTYVTDTPTGTGKALSLKARGYVRIPQNMLKGIRTYSISMWVKNFGTGGLFTTTYTDDTYNGAPRLWVNSSNCFVADGSQDIFSTAAKFGLSASQWQDDRWHMITAVYLSENSIMLYIDGELVGSAQARGTTEAMGTFMAIGGKCEDVMNGSMLVDNVRVYSVCLSAAAVKNIYKTEK